MSKCCGRTAEDIEDEEIGKQCEKDAANKPFTWHPTVNNVQQIVYVRRLQNELQNLQSTCFYLRTQLARLQFRVRQIISYDPCCHRSMVAELERIVVKDNPLNQCRPEVLPSIESYNKCMGDIKKKQKSLIKDLRGLVGDFPGPEYEFLYTSDWDKEQHDKPNPKCEEKPLEVKTSKTSTKSQKLSVKGSDSRTAGGEDDVNTISQVEVEVRTDVDNKKSSVELSKDADEASLPSERSIPFSKLRSMYQKKSTVDSDVK